MFNYATNDISRHDLPNLMRTIILIIRLAILALQTTWISALTPNRSPTLTVVTLEPVLTTVPTISWPTHSGIWHLAHPPVMTRTSLPHTPQASTAMATSKSSKSFGLNCGRRLAIAHDPESDSCYFAFFELAPLRLRVNHEFLEDV